jgi:flagellum-specific peptidoglycan hydrolase FlgJ
VVNGKDVVVNALFQRFPTLADAFLTHSQLLMAPWYASAYEVRSNWQEFAQRLSAKSSPTDMVNCGYSTNPKYGAVLIEIAEGSNLPAFLGTV